MSTKGKRKFICLECGDATYFRSSERSSRFRYRCRWCGSLALEPSKDSMAKKEITEEARRLNAGAGGFASTVPDGVLRKREK